MTTRHRAARRRVALLAPALAALLLAGCSTGGAGSEAAMSSAGSDAESGPEADAGGAAEGADRFAADTSTTTDGVRSATARTGVAAVRDRAVISTGTVDLESSDVEAARFAVQRVADQAGGEVSDEQTGTDRRGVLRRTRLVLRVPAEEFDAAMASLSDLGEVATLRSATRESEDVTTQVIDVAARVRAQEKSLERVELLLTRAQQLRDVIAIESQLTRRQAELDSLKQQQAYLADQTALSTIRVLVERREDRLGPQPEDAGFLAGLGAGWDALKGSTVAVLTAVGAVLPFAALLLLLGVPAWLLLRRLGAGPFRGGSAGRTPSTAGAGPGPSTG